MRKRIMPLLMGLTLVLCLSGSTVLASGSRGILREPNLRIDGTTAHCGVDYILGDRNATVSVTLTLKQGSTTIDSWSDSGKGMVIISETTTVQRGKTYDLVMNATVNGKTQPEVITSARS